MAKSALSGEFSPSSVSLADQPSLLHLLNEVLTEAEEKATDTYSPAKLSTLDSYARMKALDQGQKVVLITLVIKLKEQKRSKFSYRQLKLIGTLLSQLLRMKMELSQEELHLLLSGYVNAKRKYSHDWPYKPLLGQVETVVKKEPLNPINRRLLNQLQFPSQEYPSAEETRINERIQQILNKPEGLTLNSFVFPKDVIGDRLSKAQAEHSELWTPYFELLQQGASRTTPTQKWQKQIQTLFGADPNHVVDLIIECFDLTITLLKSIHKTDHWEVTFLKDKSIQYIRAMVWTTGILNNDRLSSKTEELGLWCFKKLRNYGAISVKIGNGTIYAFSALPFEEGVARLTKFRTRIKYPSVQKIIEKTLRKIADKEGKTLDEMEEISVSSYGLEGHQYTEVLGDFTARIRIVSLQKVELTWENAKGKSQKSVPSALKESHKQEITRLKAKAKDILSALRVQKERIEQFYLKNRTLSYLQWQTYYLNHPLISFITQHLIWTFSKEAKQVHLLPEGKEKITWEGESIATDFSQHTVQNSGIQSTVR